MLRQLCESQSAVTSELCLTCDLLILYRLWSKTDYLLSFLGFGAVVKWKLKCKTVTQTKRPKAAVLLVWFELDNKAFLLQAIPFHPFPCQHVREKLSGQGDTSL